MVLETRGRLDLITAPADEPVSLTEAKAHLRVDVSDDDALITSLIAAAREEVESRAGRSLRTQTWDLKIDQFPSANQPIVLPLPPLQSVTSVTYVDADGATQTWDAGNYSVDAPGGPRATRGMVIPGYGISYPTTRSQLNAVTVRFVAGYADDEAPEPLRNAMLLIVGNRYENRESAIEAEGVTQLINPYRTEWGIA